MLAKLQFSLYSIIPKPTAEMRQTLLEHTVSSRLISWIVGLYVKSTICSHITGIEPRTCCQQTRQGCSHHTLIVYLESYDRNQVLWFIPAHMKRQNCQLRWFVRFPRSWQHLLRCWLLSSTYVCLQKQGIKIHDASTNMWLLRSLRSETVFDYLHGAYTGVKWSSASLLCRPQSLSQSGNVYAVKDANW